VPCGIGRTGAEVSTRLCLFCAAPFRPLGTDQARKYCSDTCATAAKKALRQRRVRILALSTSDPDAISTADPHLPCHRCGTPVFLATCDDCHDPICQVSELVHQGGPPSVDQLHDAAFALDSVRDRP
jgi:hypothetical protein